MNINKKAIRKFIPQKLMDLGTNSLLWYFRQQWPTLEIRPGTTDVVVFRDNLLLYRIKLPLTDVSYIIDAGAYVGYQSLYFSRQYPKATIVAIEPEDSNFAQLKKHTGNQNNINCINAALWSHSGTVALTDRNTGHWGFTVNGSAEGDTRAITIPELIAQSPNNRIDILKLDIEGAEKELFQDNPETWLHAVRAIIVEIHDRIHEGTSDIIFSKLPKSDWTHYYQGDKSIFVRKE